MTEQFTNLIERRPGCHHIGVKSVAQLVRWIRRVNRARRAKSASSSLRAAGRIGEPNGSRKRLTSKKSHPRACAHALRSSMYWSKACTIIQSTGPSWIGGTSRSRR
jgi:hypothetical protein